MFNKRNLQSDFFERTRWIIIASIAAFATLSIQVCSFAFASTEDTHQTQTGHIIDINIRDDGFSPNQLIDTIHHPIHLRIHNRGHQVHEFAIPEYRIYTRNLGPGETSDIEFSPWESGSFVMYSDPEADSHPEFAGRFIVLPSNHDGQSQ